MADEKLFGKYNEIFLLVMGFALTAVVGGWLTNHYQQGADAANHRFTQAQTDLDASKTAIALYSENLGLPILRYKALVAAYNQNKDRRLIDNDGLSLIQSLDKEYIDRYHLYPMLRMEFGRRVANAYLSDAISLTSDEITLLTAIHKRRRVTPPRERSLDESVLAIQNAYGTNASAMIVIIDCKQKNSDGNQAIARCIR